MNGHIYSPAALTLYPLDRLLDEIETHIYYLLNVLMCLLKMRTQGFEIWYLIQIKKNKQIH
jgi:hypothetical protein